MDENIVGHRVYCSILQILVTGLDRNQFFPLEKVKSMVDLGVRFDNNLIFRDHISGKKINKAYNVLGIIKKKFHIYG